MKLLELFDISHLRLREIATDYRARPGFAAVSLGKNDAGEPCLVYEPIVAWCPDYMEDGGLEAVMTRQNNPRCHPHIVRCPDGSLIDVKDIDDDDDEISLDTEFGAIDESLALLYLLDDMHRDHRSHEEK
jgi:hypothetical protein